MLYRNIFKVLNYHFNSLNRSDRKKVIDKFTVRKFVREFDTVYFGVQREKKLDELWDFIMDKVKPEVRLPNPF